MSLDPAKGYRALLRHRYSHERGEYFITFCSDNRKKCLATGPVASAITAEIKQMEIEAIWEVRCAVIMPDHVHLLFAVGERLQLGKAVARLKSKSARLCGASGPRWQAGYFEHRVRPDEERLPFFLYIYLNPYRAGLLPVDATWPWFLYGEQDCRWLKDYLRQGYPEPKWLAGLP